MNLFFFVFSFFSYLSGREFNEPGRILWSRLPFDVPAARGFVAETHELKNNVTVAINVASRQERASGRGNDSKQILITKRTKKKVKKPGNKKIRATGSSIVRDTLTTAAGTGKRNGSETGTETRPAILLL
jgi:phosphatidate phosphatase APP1